jgi:hypothetical protein
MEPNTDRNRSVPSAQGAPAPRKRLRIVKLEERIAPKKGGNGTKNCPNYSGSSNDDSSVSFY